jgi:hypothetical protein
MSTITSHTFNAQRMYRASLIFVNLPGIVTTVATHHALIFWSGYAIGMAVKSRSTEELWKRR